MRFSGSETYVATRDLTLAVNAAITLQRPLLIKGEPGTGKTMLAEEVAASLGIAAVAVAYQVDDQGAAGTLRIRRGVAPARLAARRSAGARHRHYIVRGVLWQAFDSKRAGRWC
jgi:MoxR-like ATPase